MRWPTRLAPCLIRADPRWRCVHGSDTIAHERPTAHPAGRGPGGRAETDECHGREDVAMAGRPQNRLELRRQYEAAEPVDPMEDEADDASEDGGEDEGERRKKKKPKAPAKAKPKAVKAPKPSARMRIVWAVVNDAFKTIATFEFSQKDAAEARAKELMEKGKGTHFVQKVKEPMPDNAPGLGANLPRPEPVAVAEPVLAKSKAKKASVEDEDVEPDDDDEADEDADLEADSDDDDE